MPKPKRANNGTGSRHAAKGSIKPRTLEAAVVALASTGKLAGAGRSAIRAQRRAGLAITYLDGDQIVTEYPDKRRVVLRKLTRPVYTLPKGVTKLRGA